MKFSIISLLASAVLSAPTNPRKCGNDVIPSAEENARIMAEVSQYPPSQGLAATIIPVYVHIITSSDGTKGDLSNANVAKQISLLNAAYGPAGFQFESVEVNRVKNDRWFTNLDGRDWSAAGAALRQGGVNALNIFSANLPSDTLGIAQFPWDAKRQMDTDAVRCATGTFPGGTSAPYNLGDTCVHEVGHWMGLYHTFQGGCSGTGDGVADTPAISAPNFGCPVKSDSCSGGGLDDIRNFMDYTDDSCMDHFTPGQNALMNQMWNRYRAVDAVPTTTSSPVTTTRTTTTTVRTTTTKTSLATPTASSEMPSIIFPAKGSHYVTGTLVKDMEASLSYDMSRMSEICPYLRYCYKVGWFGITQCGSTDSTKTQSISIKFSTYGTTYFYFDSYDDTRTCATDSAGLFGYSLYVRS